MDPAIVIGLLIQGLAIVLLVWRLGRDFFRHIGAIFVLLAVLYHGVNEVILALFPGYDPYRRLFDTKQVAPFVLWVSVAILAFTVAYVAALGRRPPPISRDDVNRDWARSVRFFDWRIMLLSAAPLTAIILQGQQTALVQGQYVAYAGAAIGLANQYFLLAVVLASFGIVARFGRRWLIPVFMVQSALVAAIAARAVIVFAAVLLLYALGRAGIRLTRKQLVLGGGIAVVLTLAITSARAYEGHLATTSGSTLRLQFLAVGLGQIGSPTAWHQVVADLGYRFDGNSFGAMELEALDRNVPTLGTAPLRNDLFLAVPSFINPNKDAADVGTRIEKVYAEQHLGLVALELAPNQWLDILPTQLGVIMGYWGPWGMAAAALLLGFVFARADRWLLRGVGPARLLVGLGLLYCVMNYEGSWETYTVFFRGILVLLAVVFACKIVAGALRRVTTPVVPHVV